MITRWNTEYYVLLSLATYIVINKIVFLFVDTDMEDECFPVISMNTACARLSSDTIMVKDEPLSETDSPQSSCPASPQPAYIHNDTSMDTDFIVSI